MGTPRPKPRGDTEGRLHGDTEERLFGDTEARPRGDTRDKGPQGPHSLADRAAPRAPLAVELQVGLQVEALRGTDGAELQGQGGHGVGGDTGVPAAPTCMCRQS